MRGGGEPGHVHPDLGQDALGGPLADPGDGVEVVTGPDERDAGLADAGGEQGVHALVQLGDGALQIVDVLQAQPDQQGVVVTKAATQGLT